MYLILTTDINNIPAYFFYDILHIVINSKKLLTRSISLKTKNCIYLQHFECYFRPIQQERTGSKPLWQYFQQEATNQHQRTTTAVSSDPTTGVTLTKTEALLYKGYTNKSLKATAEVCN